MQIKIIPPKDKRQLENELLRMLAKRPPKYR